MFDGAATEIVKRQTAHIYPNPTTGTIYMEGDLKNAVITDIYGKIVWSNGAQQTASLQGFMMHEISLQNLPDGIYLLYIPNNKTTKIILTKNQR